MPSSPIRRLLAVRLPLDPVRLVEAGRLADLELVRAVDAEVRVRGPRAPPPDAAVSCQPGDGDLRVVVQGHPRLGLVRSPATLVARPIHLCARAHVVVSASDSPLEPSPSVPEYRMRTSVDAAYFRRRSPCTGTASPTCPLHPPVSPLGPLPAQAELRTFPHALACPWVSGPHTFSVLASSHGNAHSPCLTVYTGPTVH